MSLDVVIILILSAWAVFGFATGAMKQIAHIASLVLAFLLARPGGRLIAAFLIERRGQSPSIAMVLGTLLAGVVVYSLVKIFFWIVNSYLGGEERKTSVGSRLLGAVLSSAKAAVVVWLMVCLLMETALLNVPQSATVTGWLNNISERLGRSEIATWMAETYNPVSRLRIRSTLDKLKRISEDPQAVGKLARNEDVKVFLHKLRMQMLGRLKDKKTRASVERCDPAAIIKAARLRDFLDNRELIEALLEINLETVIEDALKELPDPPAGRAGNGAPD